MPVGRGRVRQQRLQLAQPLAHHRKALAHIRAERVEHFGRLRLGDGRHRRRLRLELAARARDRQTLAEHELLDLLNVLEIDLPVQPRAVWRFCLHADARKLLLPGTQHIRLHLQQLADFPGLVQLGSHCRQYTRFNRALPSIRAAASAHEIG